MPVESLNAYGSCLATYSGEGILQYEDRAHACHFAAGQVCDGKVILLCEFQQPNAHLLQQLLRRSVPSSFRGETSNGTELVADGSLYGVNWLSGDREGFCDAFFVQQLQVKFPCEKPAEQWRVGLTNFIFTGTESSVEESKPALPIEIPVESQPIKLHIIPVDSYAERVKRMQTLKTIEVTCECVAWSPLQLRIEDLLREVDNVCYVLSVARGTKVQWVYCEARCCEGTAIERRHSMTTTKPYAGMCPIDYRSEARDDTVGFLCAALPTFRQLRKQGLEPFVVDAYLDAKSEIDYLEMRGAKMAVAVEALKSVFALFSDAKEHELIVPKHRFRTIAESMHAALTGSVSTFDLTAEEKEALLEKSKLTELNRRSFRYQLRRLCEYVGMTVADRELSLFVKSRNRLVHTGRFLCQACKEGDSGDRHVFKRPAEEFFFLVNFLDRLFLRLLGYSGVYLDWRHPGDPRRAELT